MKNLLHNIALKAERFADRFHRVQSTNRVIDAYKGYATAMHLVIRGRVLTATTRKQAQQGSGRVANFRQMLALFLTDEVANVTVVSGGIEAVTDEEGYFTLLLPRPVETGWIDVTVHIKGSDVSAQCQAFAPAPSAQLMVISDIDDTVMETGAYSLMRNLWTSMTGSTLTRKIYPDAVRLISDLSANGQNPVFYVSSSPWNLYGFLTEIFDRSRLTPAPMFLRDLGLSETKFITDGHGNHKGGSIDMLVRAHPDLRVILLGDTGQEDSAIYAQIAQDHPDRVAAVVLRETADGSDERDHAPMRELKGLGVSVFHGPEFPPSQAVLEAVHKKSPAQAGLL